MSRSVKVGDRIIGDGQPTFIIAEIGINHNGSVEIAKKIISGAVAAGADCVKFQKRTPELCVPKDQWNLERDTPWGRMTYIDYRYKVEFGINEYAEIDEFCAKSKIQWTVSCWDEPSVDFMEEFNLPFYKAPSASLTDHELLKKFRSTGRPLMISTGMSSIDEINNALEVIGKYNLMMAHSTSTYPCKIEELNLKCIQTYKDSFNEIPIGYSGHEVGLAPTFAAVTLGANFVERHITLDRAMWGTDQAASVEIGGFIRLVSNIRDIESSIGDGVKRVYDSELPVRAKLRRVL
ncbi:MAG: N-acetylneuraminate synthase family protein [Candidatus Kapabacteria bacterium]|nr:N-acetylneuraminate synthase family protein [Ignavibacteriota bacterium]MCW5884751.1 N-acetylneuraminate synthase family protein [Candidatus Kapabacteria bacterium]